MVEQSETYIVFAAGTMCGPMRIQASSPFEAARAYVKQCPDERAEVWVWEQLAYESDPLVRPEPYEFPAEELALPASA